MNDECAGSLPEDIRKLLGASFVIVDKPCGPSSHEVSAWVRKILGSEKSGHSGTLDPQVSGVLPVGLGRATKLMPFLAAKDKKYVCLMRTRRQLTEKEINGLFARFCGEITQTPPKQSAVAKRPRKRKIYYIKLLQLKPNNVLFEVHCEAGTYIRVLVSDFGRLCGGAKMLELRRIAVGSILEESAHTLHEITDAAWLAFEKRDASRLREILVPVTAALPLPKMVVRDSAVEAVCAGAPLFSPGLVSCEGNIGKGSHVAFMTCQGELIGIGRCEASSDEISRGQKGAIGVPIRTIMKRGTYPKAWHGKGMENRAGKI